MTSGNSRYKFRAWCDPCYSFVPTMQLFHGDEGLMMYCPMHEGGVIKTKLTEWTGLLDKNGVEIYEGDILSDKWKAQAYFKNGSYWVKSHVWQNNDTYLHAFIKSREQAKIPVEVIGNIYENPELLE